MGAAGTGRGTKHGASARRRIAAYGRGLRPTSLAGVAPGLATFMRYDRSDARHDLIAGITVGIVAVPSSLAMGELAGLPVQFGLYATFLPLVAYGLLAASRQHVIGPDATLAALTASTLAPLATVGGAVDPMLYAALAAALAIAMGGLLLLAGVLHLGFIGDFFGKPVLLGYINGVAVSVIAGQVEKLLGIDIEATDFVPMAKETVAELGDLNWPTVLLSAALLAIAVAVRRLVPRFPGSIAVLVAALVLARVLDLEQWDIAAVGAVDSGLPPIGFPDVTLSQFTELLLPACAFGLIAFADTVATVRTFARRHDYEVDADRELTALGGANLLGGLTSAFPISSSSSRSAVNDAAGAQTQAAVLVAALVVGMFLLFLMPLIESLPKAALGVVIVVAAAGLIDVRSIWRLRHIRPAEVGLAIAAFAGVLLFGVLGGVAIAIGLSIGVFLYRGARPHDAVLGRQHDLDGYHDIERWQGAQTVPGMVIYRFDAPPFFVNAEYLRRRVLEVVDAADDLEWLILNAEAWMFVDATAIDVLKELHSELAARGISLGFARLKGRQREIFEKTGLIAQVGADRFFPTVGAAVTAFEAQ